MRLISISLSIRHSWGSGLWQGKNHVFCQKMLTTIFNFFSLNSHILQFRSTWNTCLYYLLSRWHRPLTPLIFGKEDILAQRKLATEPSGNCIDFSHWSHFLELRDVNYALYASLKSKTHTLESRSILSKPFAVKSILKYHFECSYSLFQSRPDGL